MNNARNVFTRARNVAGGVAGSTITAAGTIRAALLGLVAILFAGAIVPALAPSASLSALSPVSILRAGDAPQIDSDLNATTTAGEFATGGKVTFGTELVITGDPVPTYQWQEFIGEDWQDIAGETATTLTLTNLKFTDNGRKFRITSTNDGGTTASAASTLSVPAVLNATTTATDFAAGGKVTFGKELLPADYSTVAFQWQEFLGGSVWTNITHATASTYSLSGLKTTDSGRQFRVVLTVTTGSAKITLESNSTVLEVPPVPVNTVTSPYTVGAFFNVSASTLLGHEPAADSAVQWQEFKNNNWTDIPGATSATLPLSGLFNSTDNGRLFRVIETKADTSTETSEPAILVVRAIPTVATGGNITLGSSATFDSALLTSATIEAGSTFQWQEYKLNLIDEMDWQDIASETGATLTLSNLFYADNDRLFRVVIKSPLSVITNSESSTLVVAPILPAFVQDLSATSTVTAGTVTLAVDVTGDPAPTYQWQRFVSNAWKDIAGEISTSLTLTDLTYADNNTRYRVVATNAGASVPSTVTTLSVAPTPLSFTVNLSENAVAVNGIVTLGRELVIAGDPAPTYQWQVSKDDGQTWENITGETQSELALTAENYVKDGASYRVVVKNALDNVGITSDATVPNPVFTQDIPTEINAYYGYFKIAGKAAGVETLTYQWQEWDEDAAPSGDWVNLDAQIVPGADSPTLELDNLTDADLGRRFRLLVIDGNQKEWSSSETIIKGVFLVADVPDPYLTQNFIDAEVTAANDGTGNITVTLGEELNAPGSPTYRWEYSTDNGGSWINVLGPNNAPTFTEKTLTLNNLKYAQDGTQYRVVVYTALGTVLSDIITVKVPATAPVFTTDLPATATAINSTITIGANFVVTGDPEPTIKWQEWNAGSSTWEDIAGEIKKSLTLKDLTYDDTGRQFRVLATNVAGATASSVLTLTGPSIRPFFTTDLEAEFTVAPGTAILGENIVIAGDPTPPSPELTYQWYEYKKIGTNDYRLDEIDGAVDATLTLTNLEFADTGRQFLLIVKNAAGERRSNVLTLFVNPTAPYFIDNFDAVTDAVNGGDITLGTDLHFSGDPAPTTYQWQRAKLTRDDDGNILDKDDGSIFSDPLTQEPEILEWENLPNETKATLELTKLKYADSGLYRLVLGNGDITVTVASDATFLNVPAVAPTFAPTFRKEIDQGGSIIEVQDTDGNIPAPPAGEAFYSVHTASGTISLGSELNIASDPSPKFQWEMSNDNGGSWELVADEKDSDGNDKIKGATARILVLYGLKYDTDNGRLFRVNISNVAGDVTSREVRITVGAPPAFSQALPTSVTAVAGTATIGLAAGAKITGDPTPTDFQWQERSGNSWLALDGATDDTLILSNLRYADNDRQFRLVVKNVFGEVISNSTTLIVPPTLPSFSVNLSSEIIAGSDGSVTLGSELVYDSDPAPISVRWQRSTDGGATWSPIVGEESPTLTLSGLKYADSGTLYRLVVTNLAGGTASASASLTVPATLPAFTTDLPATATAVNGAVTLGAGAVVTGDPAATFQWEEFDGLDEDGSTEIWSPLEDETEKTLFLADLKYADSGRRFRLIASNAGGSTASAVTTIAVPAIAPGFAAGGNLKSNAIASNGSITLGSEIVLTGDPLDESGLCEFLWETKGTYGQSDGLEWVAIPGAIEKTLTLSGLEYPTDNGRRYRLTITNPAGSITSNILLLSVPNPDAPADNEPPVETPADDEAAIDDEPASELPAGEIGAITGTTGGIAGGITGTGTTGKAAANIETTDNTETIPSIEDALIEETTIEETTIGTGEDTNTAGTGEPSETGTAGTAVQSSPSGGVYAATTAGATPATKATGTNPSTASNPSEESEESEISAPAPTSDLQLTLHYGNTSVSEGTSHTLHAAVTGALDSDGALSYRWFFSPKTTTGTDASGIADASPTAFKEIKNANSACLTFDRFTSANAGLYYVTVKNDADEETSESVSLDISLDDSVYANPDKKTKLSHALKFDKTAGLTLNTATYALATAVKNGVIIAPENAEPNYVEFNTKLDAAPETPVIYTWFDGKTDITEFSLSGGAPTYSQTDTLSYTPHARSKISVTVRTEHTNYKGKTYSTAKSKTIAIKPVLPPTVNISNRRDDGSTDATGTNCLTVAAGKSVTLKTKVTGTAKLTYQWLYSTTGTDDSFTDAVPNVANPAALKKSSLTLKPINKKSADTAENTVTPGFYRLLVTNPAGTAFSAAATIEIR